MTLSKPNISYEVGDIHKYDDDLISTSEIRILSQEGDKFKLLYNNKVFLAAIRSFDIKTKQARINLDGYDFTITVKEPIDHLIKDLGFLTLNKHSVKEIKSPMPGLVVNVYVEVGQTVSEGDKLLSLEAMKMENILKSPGDGIVKSIAVVKGSTVDKSQLLITFE
jgi:biotin carboxyl carrier protein